MIQRYVQMVLIVVAMILAPTGITRRRGGWSILRKFTLPKGLIEIEGRRLSKLAFLLGGKSHVLERLEWGRADNGAQNPDRSS